MLNFTRRGGEYPEYGEYGEYASNATLPQTMHSRCWAGAGAESPVSRLGISVLTPILETLLTLRNPAFQGISDESSILLTWQT